MSVAAVLLVKDEADVVGFTIDHLLREVDAVYVSDNGSTDGTLELLTEKAGEHPNVLVSTDPEVAYWQSAKTTALAMRALADGHQWVVPCDADEAWYANGRPLREHLLSQAGDVMVVQAEVYDHVPSVRDDASEPNPFARVAYRKVYPLGLGKVACRLRYDLVIGPGNHSARTSGTGLAVPGIFVRHFSWRSEEQYLRKIANGARAYAETDLPDDVGKHWRMYGSPDAPDFADHVRANFRESFFSYRPGGDASLTRDPAVNSFWYHAAPADAPADAPAETAESAPAAPAPVKWPA